MQGAEPPFDESLRQEPAHERAGGGLLCGGPQGLEPGPQGTGPGKTDSSGIAHKGLPPDHHG